MLGAPSHNFDKSKLGHITLCLFPFQAFKQANCERIESSRVSKFVSFFPLLRCAVSLVLELCAWICLSRWKKGPTGQLPSQKFSTESLFYGCQMTSCFSCFEAIACTLYGLNSPVPFYALWCNFQCLTAVCFFHFFVLFSHLCGISQCLVNKQHCLYLHQTSL